VELEPDRLAQRLAPRARAAGGDRGVPLCSPLRVLAGPPCCGSGGGDLDLEPWLVADRGGAALPTTSSQFAALAMRCRRSLAVVAADLGGPNSSFSRWWW
jgi:hypothetical protein